MSKPPNVTEQDQSSGFGGATSTLTEYEAPTQCHSQALKFARFAFSFDAFDDFHGAVVRHKMYGAHRHCWADLIDVDVVDNRYFEFHVLRLELDNMAQTRVSSAGVIYGDVNFGQLSKGHSHPPHNPLWERVT
jgi:hypothetical protein